MDSSTTNQIMYQLPKPPQSFRRRHAAPSTTPFGLYPRRAGGELSAIGWYQELGTNHPITGNGTSIHGLSLVTWQLSMVIVNTSGHKLDPDEVAEAMVSCQYQQ